MRSTRKTIKKTNTTKKAALTLALGAFMMLSTGFTGAGVNEVAITVDGRTFEMRTNAESPQEIFDKAGIKLAADDEYVYGKEDNKTVLTVYRAVPVTVEYNGEKKEIMTSRPTVGEALEEAGYYTEYYDSSLDLNTTITKNLHIKLNDNAAMIAKRQEEEEARRQSVETSRGLARYSAALTMEASAYLPGDGGGSGITASGIPASYGVAAVDPAIIPLGTRLYIPGYGEAVAADTGGAIVGHKIDLCMEDYGEAIQFGRRDVTVYVLQ